MSRNEDIHDHNTRHKQNVHMFFVKHKFASDCLRYNLVKSINDCPSCIKDKVNTHSIQGFSTYIKNYLIGKYSENCQIENCYICKKDN